MRALRDDRVEVARGARPRPPARTRGCRGRAPAARRRAAGRGLPRRGPSRRAVRPTPSCRAIRSARRSPDRRRRSPAAIAPRSMSRSAVVSSSTSTEPARSPARRIASRSTRGHRAAGRVLEVGHQVRHDRQRARERLLGAIEIPAVVGEHRHADEARAGAAERIRRVRIGRRLDQHAVAPAEEHRGDEVDRALRARRDEHLARRGRDPAPRVPLGDRLAQLGAAEHVVADPRHQRGRRSGGDLADDARRAPATPADSPAAGRSTPSAALVAAGVAAPQRQRDAARAARARDVARSRAGCGTRRRRCCGSAAARPRARARREGRCAVRAGCRDRAGGCRRPAPRTRARACAIRRARPTSARAEIRESMRPEYPYWTVAHSPIVRLDGPMPRRVIQLLVGLFLYGAGCALTDRGRPRASTPGRSSPQGLSIHTGHRHRLDHEHRGLPRAAAVDPAAAEAGHRHDRQHPPRRHEHAGRALDRPAGLGARRCSSRCCSAAS